MTAVVLIRIPVRSKVIGPSGFDAGPLGNRTPIDTQLLPAFGDFKPLWPTRRGVLPGLLSAVDGQVK
jgi:hypothetical protein